MNSDTLPFENIIIKAEKNDDEDFPQQSAGNLETVDENHDPLHDFPIDIEDVKIEIPENSALPGDGPNFIKQEDEEKCSIKTEAPSLPVDGCHMNILDRNLRLHSPEFEKSFLCYKCFAKFSSQGDLNSHKLAHHPQKTFQCSICKSVHPTENGLNRHMRSHTQEKPFKCETCLKSFKEKYLLVHHTRFHTSEKPYSCEHCQKKYRRRSDLAYHLQTHEEKTVVCEMCSWRCHNEYQLSKHVLVVHTGEVPYSCHVCSAKFNKKRMLSTHMRCHMDEQSNLSDSQSYFYIVLQ